ncbi:MAG TPA: M1 family metallopeptidase, partial [Bacteroidia bacterium]|nr:M1 family metallopeptidase [Bacteroidia bacterium]
MNKLLAILLLFQVIISPIFGQGKPYFQQEVHYKIDCALNDKNHTLAATMELEYINRSSDTLTFLYFHLWPNAYKDRTTALAKQQLQHKNTKMFFAKPEERGYIDSLNFKSDGRQLRYQLDKNNIDICKIDLSKPLYPGQRVIITTPFFVKIPNAEFSRLGHIGQAYAITQWYPKPAVYDNKGWHAIPYLDQGEFYSEYGSYDVSITLPANYVVGATGDLVDGAKELEWMNTKASATAAMSFPERSKDFKPDMNFPPSSSEMKTLKFHQENVHDFGWFADKRFNVLKGESIMPRSGKHVTTWSLFTNKEAYLWKRGPEYIKDALEYYSKWVGDYPYNQCTAVDGTIAAGGGMEYPNVTIIGTSGNALTLEVTIAHEVGHNWFYGLFGSNEREHPWMDEGINSFYEMRYWLTKYPTENGKNENDLGASLGWIGKVTGLDKLDYKQTFDFEYNIPASARIDQPIEGAGPDCIDLNYGAIVYRKTGLVFQYLRSYLGDNVFDKAMQDYFVKWCYKHPYPEDMKASFEQSTGQDLDWFFDDVIGSNKKLNYGISSIKKSSDGYALTIKDRGNLRTPVSIAGMKNGVITSQHWLTPSNKFTKDTINCSDCDHVVIDPNYNMPDVNRINNSVKTKGIFKKIEPLSLNFLAKVQYPAKNRLFLAPSIAWNNYNGFMGGLVVHNIFLPVRNFEFVSTPMYGFKDGEIAGMANMNYKFYMPKGPFTSITLGLSGQRFAYATNNINQNSTLFHSETKSDSSQRFYPILLHQ